MIWTIAKKELLVHIKSMRFGIALVLCSSVIALSAYVSGLDYAKRLSAYNSAVERHRQALRQVKVYSYLRPVVDLPPAPLSIFSRGVERNLPHSITLSHAHIPTILSGEMEKSPLSLFADPHFFLPGLFSLDIFQYSTKNPLLSALSSFDIASVIGILLSLFALLLTFDAVSGERERGVLALELSNPVSRGEVFLGKYLGAFLALLFPLGIGFAIVLLVMGLSPSIKLGPEEISGVALVFGISLLYVSSFLMLGLFVSSSTKEASTSLIVLLVVWAVFVVVVPSGTGYFLSGRFPRDAWEKLHREVDALWREFRKKEGEIRKKLPFRGVKAVTTQEDGKMSVLVGSSEALLSILEQNKRIEPLRVEYALKEWRLYQEHLRPLMRWASLVKEVSRISPASQYSNAISAVAGTDLEGYESFVRQARTYREKLVEFLRDKFGTLRYFTPIKREEMMPEEKVMELLRGGFSSFSWDDVEPVDVSGLPSFVISHPGPTEGLGRASVDIGLLALFNVLFFLLGYLMFLRYDARWS